MLLSSLVPLLFAAAPVAVSAKGMLGWALGNIKPDGSCKSQNDYEDDMKVLKQETQSNLVRTYTSGGCDTAQNIIPAAKSQGFKVVLGTWPDTDDAFDKDKDALQKSVKGNEDAIYAITVGSETLYRGNFTGEELLGKIKEVSDLFPGVTVGTADSWNKWADGTGDAVVKGGVKLILSNAFSYWQAQPIENGTATYFDDMMQSIGHIQSTAGCIDCIQVINGETGWPGDEGSSYGPAKASTENAAKFWKSGVCGMLDWGYDLFFFEAFDEPGKPDSIGQDGNPANEKHWGAFNADRTKKFDLSC